MRNATKLAKSERSEIEILLRKGYSQRRIASVLGRSPNTISYEIKTNGGTNGYKASNAHIYACQHLKSRRLQYSKIESNNELKAYLIEGLRNHWNPDEIAGSMKTEKKPFYVSKTAIYEWLYSSRGQQYCKYLYTKRYTKKKRPPKKRSRDMIPNRTSINKRSVGADNRSRYGHTEIDTIVGKRGTKGGLSVLSERKSRLLAVQKVASMSCIEHVHIHKKMMSKLTVKSITFDNGIENKDHKRLAVPTYFCDPYSSWQKGGVENANKMIRRYFPKKTDFQSVSQKEVDHIVSIINNKPRKILGYRSALAIAKRAGIIRDSVLIEG